MVYHEGNFGLKTKDEDLLILKELDKELWKNSYDGKIKTKIKDLRQLKIKETKRIFEIIEKHELMGRLPALKTGCRNKSSSILVASADFEKVENFK